jgi:PAS domain S-box-containing protein
MQTFNFPLDTAGRTPILGYAVAVLSVAAALICTLQMETRWQASAPVAMLLMAVIVTTRLGGPRPALLATVLSLLGFACFVLPLPQGSLGADSAQAVRLLALVLVAGYIVWVTATTRDAVESLRHAHDELRHNNEALRLENAERRRTEQQLRVSEAKFRALAESAPAAILIYREGRICYANPEAEAITGYSAAELGELGRLQAVVPDLPELLRGRALTRTHAESAARRYQLRMVTRAGEERWLGLTCAAFEFEGKSAAVAMACDVTERIRAESALQASATRLQHLSRRLLALQEEERRHLARELHDELGQLLATVTVQLSLAGSTLGEAARASLEESIAQLQRAAEELRGLVLRLRPTMLDSAGLLATLRWLADQNQQHTGIATEVIGQVDDVAGDLAIACFRVVQEALTNVVRHARAQHVWIELRQREGRLELEVRDDGVGFDVETTLERAAARGSVGLLGMKERVQILGGHLEVESIQGCGTWIRLSVPVTSLETQSEQETA